MKRLNSELTAIEEEILCCLSFAYMSKKLELLAEDMKNFNMYVNDHREFKKEDVEKLVRMKEDLFNAGSMIEQIFMNYDLKA